MKKVLFVISVLLILSGCSGKVKTFSEEIRDDKIVFANVFLVHENIGKKIPDIEYKNCLDFLSSIDANPVNTSDYEQTVGQYYYFEIVLKSGNVVIYSGEDFIFVNEKIYKINNADSVKEKADTIVNIKFGI